MILIFLVAGHLRDESFAYATWTFAAEKQII